MKTNKFFCNRLVPLFEKEGLGEIFKINPPPPLVNSPPFSKGEVHAYD
jgi:hypothetical protein